MTYPLTAVTSTEFVSSCEICGSRIGSFLSDYPQMPAEGSAQRRFHRARHDSSYQRNPALVQEVSLGPHVAERRKHSSCLALRVSACERVSRAVGVPSQEF